MYKVIIADDEPWILEDIIEMSCWNECGFEIIGKAMDGEEALNLVKKLKPDLVLTDIRMPFINGLDLIKEICTINNNIITIFISAYSDFIYAQQAIRLGAFDYILKPIEEDYLKKVLERARILLNDKSNFALKVEHYENVELFHKLLDNNLNDKFVKEKLRGFQLPEEKQTFQILSIKANAIEENQINNLEEIFISSPGIKFLSACVGYGNYIYLLSYNNFHETEITLLLNTLYDELKVSSINIGVSDCYDILTKTKNAYKQANIAICQSFITNKNGIYKYKNENPEYLSAIINEIRNINSIGQLKFLFAKIKEVIYDFEINININGVTKIYNEILLAACKLTENKIFLDTITTDDIVIMFENIDQLFLSLIEEFGCEKQDQNLQKYSTTLNEILGYINENYNKKIQLFFIAKTFHINPNYLSQMFKQKLNTTFTEYITNLKLKEAVELIEKTNMTMYEISEKVGYDDYFHFSKVFKKSIGISPSGYKRNLN